MQAVKFRFRGNSDISKKYPYFTLKLYSNIWTLKNFAQHVDHCWCCQLSSTNNRFQFITLTVQLKVQYDGRAWQSASCRSVYGSWDLCEIKLRGEWKQTCERATVSVVSTLSSHSVLLCRTELLRTQTHNTSQFLRDLLSAHRPC